MQKKFKVTHLNNIQEAHLSRQRMQSKSNVLIRYNKTIMLQYLKEQFFLYHFTCLGDKLLL